MADLESGAVRRKVVPPAPPPAETEGAEPAPDDRKPERTDRELGKDRQHQQQTRDGQGKGGNRPLEAVEGPESSRDEVERRAVTFPDRDP